MPHKVALNDPKLAKTSVDKRNIELVSAWYTENLEQSTSYDAIKISDSVAHRVSLSTVPKFPNGKC